MEKRKEVWPMGPEAKIGVDLKMDPTHQQRMRRLDLIIKVVWSLHTNLASQIHYWKEEEQRKEEEEKRKK